MRNAVALTRSTGRVRASAISGVWRRTNLETLDLDDNEITRYCPAGGLTKLYDVF